MQPSTLPINFFSRLTLAFAPFQPLLPHCVNRLRNKPSILISLRALILSCRSFCKSNPFFSTACRLFVQNTRGGGFPQLHVAPLQINLSLLCFHDLTNCFSRNPFILNIICVAPPVWGCVLSNPQKRCCSFRHGGTQAACHSHNS